MSHLLGRGHRIHNLRCPSSVCVHMLNKLHYSTHAALSMFMFKDFMLNSSFFYLLKRTCWIIRRKCSVTNFNMQLFSLTSSLHPRSETPFLLLRQLRTPGEHQNKSHDSFSQFFIFSLCEVTEETRCNKQLTDKHLPPCSAAPLVLRRFVLKFSRSVRANRAKHRPALFIHQGVFTHKSFTL